MSSGGIRQNRKEWVNEETYRFHHLTFLHRTIVSENARVMTISINLLTTEVRRDPLNSCIQEFGPSSLCWFVPPGCVHKSIPYLDSSY